MSDGFRYDLIGWGSSVLCALSGGADSMYLLCRLLEGAERGGYTVRCAHYNHHLRPSADRDEAFVRGWCRERGVPLTVGGGDVGGEAKARGMTVEECAREMRYRFLSETARETGCTLVATGHHAGDNAETVLMNLIRGSGSKGLCGIREKREEILRPMLTVTRKEIGEYLAANGIPHVEDETNEDDRYTRNKVRRRLIPLMEELNPRAAEHINALSARLREDEELLSGMAEELLSGKVGTEDGWAVPVEPLRAAPRPLALRACAQMAELARLGVHAVHLEHILALCRGDDPSARVDVPGGTVRREYDRLVFGRYVPAEPEEAVPLKPENRWGTWIVSCREEICPEKAYISNTSFFLRTEEYVIRSRRPGDEIKLGRRPGKPVKKLMMEAKIPAHRRDHVPVLDCGGEVAALGGFGPDAGFLANSGEMSLHITLTEENAL